MKRYMAGEGKRHPRVRVLTWCLLAIVLPLAGCGGSSGSDSTPPGSTGSFSTSSAASAGSGQGSSGGGAAGAAAKAGKEVGATANGGGEGEGSSSRGKHGPRVAQPKAQREPQITPEQREEATVASMSLRSPNSVPGEGQLETLPAAFTCDGKNTSPALRWNGVPAGTQELALFAMNVQPIEDKLFFDWAVGGIDPAVTEIEADELPKGAIVGRNGFGRNDYEICPQAGGEIYMFALFALPTKLSPQKGFDPHDLRQEALDASGNVGLLPLTYVRG